MTINNVRIKLDDEYKLSLAQGLGAYGDNDTVEIAMFNSRGDFVKLANTDDVLGWIDGKALYHFLKNHYGE